MARPEAWQWLERRRRLMPAVLLLGAGLVDFITPPAVSAAAFYAAAILMAAPLLSLRGTILTGLCAFLVDLASFVYFGYHRSGPEVSELAMVATVTVIAVFVNRLLHHLQTQLRSARDIAAAVQCAVLPDPPKASGPLRFAARYEAAQTDAQIGGDLYAVLDTPFGVRCVIGDVRGKGMDAVRAVAASIVTFREAALYEPTLTGVVERLERAAVLETQQSGSETELEGFITGVVAEFPQNERAVRLVNRGHPAPVLLLPDDVRYVEPSRPAVPLGMAALADDDPAPVDLVAFPEGATLLLYTDGLTEARDKEGVFYDPVGGAAMFPDARPDALLDALLADVHRHTGDRRTDDMALLAIACTPDALKGGSNSALAQGS